MKRDHRAAELFDALVGRRTGIVRHVNFVNPIDSDTPLFYAGATIANAHPVWGDHDGLNVGGCGTTKADAMIAALCEGAERYAASSYDASQPCQLAGDLGGKVDDSIESHSLVRWVKGFNSGSGEPCQVPAAKAYVFYQPRPGETVIGPGHSSGLACADSLDAAIERGICELIERDAMTIAWLKGVSPPRVDPVTVMEIAGELAPPDDDVRVYDLTTDVGVPVMLVVCRGPSLFGQIVATGCACRSDPRAALRHAMKEASQTRVYVRLLIEHDPYWQVEPDFSNVTDFSLHARMYTGRPKLVDRALAFLDHNDESSRAFDDLSDGPIERELTRLIDSVVVDLTQSWAESIGLYVVRVVANGLMPLHGDRRFVTIDHPRLANWGEVFPNGVRKHEHELWPYPHPFP